MLSPLSRLTVTVCQQVCQQTRLTCGTTSETGSTSKQSLIHIHDVFDSLWLTGKSRVIQKYFRIHISLRIKGYRLFGLLLQSDGSFDSQIRTETQSNERRSKWFWMSVPAHPHPAKCTLHFSFSNWELSLNMATSTRGQSMLVCVQGCQTQLIWGPLEVESGWGWTDPVFSTFNRERQWGHSKFGDRCLGPNGRI